MRYLIFTDIHGNLEALLAVLEFAEKKNIDHYIFLGDLVGYGADPGKVINKIRSLKSISYIRGNHDKAVANINSLEGFNSIAAAAILWTRENLSDDNMDFLTQLKKGPSQVKKDITICHGAPFDEDYYIFGELDAAEAFNYLETPITFFGHTHLPFVYSLKNSLVKGTYISGKAEEVELKENIKFLINPGSVGQPRDRNSLAACAIYQPDQHKITFYRLKYDIKKAQDKIRKAGLPHSLADRLSVGV
ncbi:MAG: metallophosphoesterase [Candidatus Aminicenantes bacterium]|nr:metallophosphoesterase [Candidatus Aminicenantes bacterium]